MHAELRSCPTLRLASAESSGLHACVGAGLHAALQARCTPAHADAPDLKFRTTSWSWTVFNVLGLDGQASSPKVAASQRHPFRVASLRAPDRGRCVAKSMGRGGFVSKLHPCRAKQSE